MEARQIVAELDREIERLRQVRSLLAGGGMSGGGKKAAPKKRIMSAKARKAISDAQKRRWAKQKAAAK